MCKLWDHFISDKSLELHAKKNAHSDTQWHELSFSEWLSWGSEKTWMFLFSHDTSWPDSSSTYLIAKHSLHVIKLQLSGWTCHVYPSINIEYTQTHPPAKNKGWCMGNMMLPVARQIQLRGILKTERHVALCPVTFNSTATVSLTCSLVISEVNTDVKIKPTRFRKLPRW